MEKKSLLNDLLEIKRILVSYIDNNNETMPTSEILSLTAALQKIDACIEAINRGEVFSAKEMIQDFASSMLKYCGKEIVETVIDSFKHLS